MDPRRGSVCDRREGAVRGYRKARDIRSAERREIERPTCLLHHYGSGITEHDAPDFTRSVVARLACGQQALLQRSPVGRHYLNPTIAGKTQ